MEFRGIKLYIVIIVTLLIVGLFLLPDIYWLYIGLINL